MLRRYIIATTDKDEGDWIAEELSESSRFVRVIDSLSFFRAQWEGTEANGAIFVENVITDEGSFMRLIKEIHQLDALILFIHLRHDDDRFLKELTDLGVIAVSYMDLEPGLLANRLLSEDGYQPRIVKADVIVKEDDYLGAKPLEEPETKTDPEPEIQLAAALENEASQQLEQPSAGQAKLEPIKDSVEQFKQNIKAKNQQLFEKILEKQKKMLQSLGNMPVRKSQPIERIVYRTEFIGKKTIAVAGASRRSGASYAAMQISSHLGSRNLKVALVELEGFSPSTLQAYETRDEIKNGFNLDGIDCYPNADTSTLSSIVMMDYEYIVFDFGQLVDLESKTFCPHINEFARSALHFITVGSSLWDLDSMVRTLDLLFNNDWKQELNFLVNFSTKESFSEMNKDFSKKERQEMKINLYQNEIASDPFDKITSNWITEFEMLTKKNKKLFSFKF